MKPSALHELLAPIEANASTPETDSLVRADMPESVLDGRLGEIYQLRMKHFPIAYAWGSLVTVAGSLIPRVNRPIRTNLFWCPVGPTHSGKSSAMETAISVLGIVPPVLLEAKFGSAEALAEALKDAEPDSVRLLWVDELAHLLEKSKIDRSSFPMVLNTAYYRDQQAGGSKSHQFTLDCRLSIAGGIVEDLFGDSFGLTTVGGLYDRFTFGLCPQPYQHLWRPFEGSAETVRPHAAFVEGDVFDVRDEWVTKRSIPARVAEHALRVAYICACVDARPSLRAAELEPALAFAQYQTRVRKLLAPNPGENPDARCAIAIRSWLHQYASGGRWARRRELDRGISAYRFGPGVFNRCLNNLHFNQEIEVGAKGWSVRLLNPADSC